MSINKILPKYDTINPATQSFDANFNPVPKNSRWVNLRNLILYVICWLTFRNRSRNPQLDTITNLFLNCPDLLAIPTPEHKKKVLNALNVQKKLVEVNWGGDKGKIETMIRKVAAYDPVKRQFDQPAKLLPEELNSFLEACRKKKLNDLVPLPELKEVPKEVWAKVTRGHWADDLIEAGKELAKKSDFRSVAHLRTLTHAVEHFFEPWHIERALNEPFFWKLFERTSLSFQVRTIKVCLLHTKSVPELERASPAAWEQVAESSDYNGEALKMLQGKPDVAIAYLNTCLKNGKSYNVSGFLNTLCSTHGSFPALSRLREEAFSNVGSSDLTRPAQLAVLDHFEAKKIPLIHFLLDAVFSNSSATELLNLPRDLLLSHLDWVTHPKVRSELLKTLGDRALEIWWRQFWTQMADLNKIKESDPGLIFTHLKTANFYGAELILPMMELLPIENYPERLKQLSSLVNRMQIPGYLLENPDEETVWKLFDKGYPEIQAQVILKLCNLGLHSSSHLKSQFTKVCEAPIEVWQVAGRQFTHGGSAELLFALAKLPDKAKVDAFLRGAEANGAFVGLLHDAPYPKLLQYPRPFVLRNLRLIPPGTALTHFFEHLGLQSLREAAEAWPQLVLPEILIIIKFPVEKVITALEKPDQLSRYAVALKRPSSLIRTKFVTVLSETLNALEKAPWKIWCILDQIDLQTLSDWDEIDTRGTWPRCFEAVDWAASQTPEQKNRLRTQFTPTTMAPQDIWNFIQPLDRLAQNYLLATYRLKESLSNLNQLEFMLALLFDPEACKRLQEMVARGSIEDQKMADLLEKLLADKTIPPEIRKKFLAFEAETLAKAGSPYWKLKSYYQNPLFADTELSIGSQKLPAHKVLLELDPLIAQTAFPEERRKEIEMRLKRLYNSWSFRELLTPEVQGFLQTVKPLSFENLKTPTDCTVNGLPAHRILLSSAFEFFEGSFRSNWGDSIHLKFPKISEKTLKEILGCIYTGKPPKKLDADFYKALDFLIPLCK